MRSPGMRLIFDSTGEAAYCAAGKTSSSSARSSVSSAVISFVALAIGRGLPAFAACITSPVRASITSAASPLVAGGGSAAAAAGPPASSTAASAASSGPVRALTPGV